MCRSEGSLSTRDPQEDRAVREPARRGDRLGVRRRQHLQGAAHLPRAGRRRLRARALRRWRRPPPDLAQLEGADRALRARHAHGADRARRQVRAARGRLPVGLRSAAPRRLAAGRAGWRSTGSTPRASRTATSEALRSASAGADGILIPGGFGGRGIEGKIAAARVAREQRIPYLGICLGMQVAVAEFARHVAGMEGANSTEFDLETPYPVIDLLPEQKEVADLGGTMRLGADPIKLHAGTPRAGDLRRGRHLRAPPPPLRGQQPAAQAPAERRPARVGHLARRAPGRDDRARRPPVLRRLAVPPRVQVAPRAPRAAVPRVRRRRARSAPTGAATASPRVADGVSRRRRHRQRAGLS